jgi:hypothetical protein
MNGLGRPLLASEAQQRDVRKLHKSGKSLRTIVTATGLSFRTVRTIVGRVEGTDRTTRRTNELRRLKLNASRRKSPKRANCASQCESLTSVLRPEAAACHAI